MKTIWGKKMLSNDIPKKEEATTWRKVKSEEEISKLGLN